ncbi:MAG: MarR family transcriptional regulator [Caulobacteraceae bacterium]
MQFRLNRFDVPIGMYFYLRALWLEDGLSQAALSRRVRATTPTTAMQLRRMEDRGLVRREASPADRRKVHVFLTDAGRDLEKPVLGEALANRNDAFTGFSEKEVRQTLDFLARIQKNMPRSTQSE